VVRVRVEQPEHVPLALGVHVPPVQRHSAWTRGVMPQGARPQVARPCGGCAWRGSGHDQYDFGSRGSGFQSYSSSRPRFPPRGARFLKWDMACLVFFLTLF
jgi:hypothetical protein